MVVVVRPVYAPDPVKTTMPATVAAAAASILFLTGCGPAESAAPARSW